MDWSRCERCCPQVRAVEGGSGPAPAGASFRVPPFVPARTGIWFSILERCFGVAGVGYDGEGALALVGFLDPPCLAGMGGAVAGLPAAGRCGGLGSGLIRVLTESDSAKVERLVEREEMGDRKPSQFYNDLKKQTSQPARVRRVHPKPVEESPPKPYQGSPGRS